MISATSLMFWVFAFEQPRNCETDLKQGSFFWQNWCGRCDSVNRSVKYWEGFLGWFFVWYVVCWLCYAVNEPWLTLDLIRIFMLEIQLGSVICDLYAYLHVGVLVCVFVWLCVCMIFRWDSYVFPYNGW